MNTRRNKFLIVLAALTGTVALVVWILYNTIVFRLVSTSPNLNRSVASSTSSVELTFTQDIAPASFSLNNVSGSEIVYDYKINKKTVTLLLKQLDKGMTYTIALNDIKAQNGKSIKDIRLHFATVYKPVSKLSEKEVQQGIDATDPKPRINSILNYIPYNTANFMLEQATLTDTKGNKWNGKPIVLVRLSSTTSNPQLYSQDDINLIAGVISDYLAQSKVSRSSYLLYSPDDRLKTPLKTEPLPPGYSIYDENYTGDGSPPD